MNCPFLQEARVRYCGKSACRKMIPIAGNVAQETCSTPRYKQCSVYRACAQVPERAQCPYLCESLVQSCATEPVPRLIPSSEPLLSRCGNGSYRYCDVYLGAAQPAPAGEMRDHSVGGIHVPGLRYYTRNHMWLDVTQGGACHIGLDAFLTRALGTVERITFLRQTGVHRPSAVLTACGVDLEVIFPTALLLTASNLYLGANAARLTADPYGTGWLFEGVELPGQPVSSGLIRGQEIAPWIEREIARMSAFLAECWTARRGMHLMQDGGVFSSGVLAQLSREEAVRLFHEFFWGLGV